jgi:regulation of enolase protein 1 (concanavalin A-like superfamily)
MGGAGMAFRSRLTAGGTTASIPAARGNWLRLSRVGPVITASVSSDGSQWNVVATQTLTLPSTLYVGIVVTSRAPASLASAIVSNMLVSSTTSTLPSGWASADVGAAAAAGTASYSNGSFTATSSGLGFANASDGFRFIYRRVAGDAKLQARVVASEGKPNRQAGIAFRTSLDGGAAEIGLYVDDAGVVLVQRTGAGQTAWKTRVAATIAPVYLQLDRRGSLVTVTYSTDGATWKPITSVSVAFPTELYAGLVVAGGPNIGVAAAAFDRLSLVSVAANVPPVVSLTAPLTGQSFEQGQTVTFSATASDPDDLVARVDFRVNGVKIASDSAAPYTASWTAGAPGAYTVTAVAEDFDGAVTTSSPVSITVLPKVIDSGGGTGPWRLEFDPSPDHARVQSYVLEIYKGSTRILAASRNLGKPAIAADGSCTVDINALVSGLPAGRYDGVVRAVESSTLSSESSAYTFTK